jgi:hypothetical protein
VGTAKLCPPSTVIDKIHVESVSIFKPENGPPIRAKKSAVSDHPSSQSGDALAEGQNPFPVASSGSSHQSSSLAKIYFSIDKSYIIYGLFV